MNPIVRNVLAVLAGILVGIIVNGSLVALSTTIIPLPEGVVLDPMDPESLKAAISKFEPQNFIMPFLAHALGTLAGAFVAAKIASTHKMKFALGIGAFFLIGGIMNIIDLGGPLWFKILDLVVAYFPMAWLGGRMAGGNHQA